MSEMRCFLFCLFPIFSFFVSFLVCKMALADLKMAKMIYFFFFASSFFLYVLDVSCFLVKAR